MEYYKEIENYFLAIRGKYFGASSYNLLSPKEIFLIKDWKKQNIPIKIVKSGIDESLRRFRSNNPDKIDEPPNLVYCKQTVLKLFRNLKASVVGKNMNTSEASVHDSENNIADRIITTLSKAIEYMETEKPVSNWSVFSSILDRFRSGLPQDLNLENYSVEMEKLINELRTVLPFSTRKHFLFEIRKEIADFKTRMKRTTYTQTRNALFDDTLLDFLKLSELKEIL